jgi:hypothetical protein
MLLHCNTNVAFSFLRFSSALGKLDKANGYSGVDEILMRDCTTSLNKS